MRQFIRKMENLSEPARECMDFFVEKMGSAH